MLQAMLVSAGTAEGTSPLRNFDFSSWQSVLGTLLALMKLGRFKTGRVVAGFYTWLFRGTPLLIQLLFWYNLAYLVPRIGIPFGPDWDTNEKAQAARIFYGYYRRTRDDPDYQHAKRLHQQRLS